MAHSQETQDPQLKEEAIARAARLVERLKLITSIMAEIDSDADASVSTSRPSGSFVLYPTSPITQNHTIDSHLPQYSEYGTSTTDKAIKLGSIGIASTTEDGGIILEGQTVPERIPEAVYAFTHTAVLFNPDEHQLALYVDENR